MVTFFWCGYIAAPNSKKEKKETRVSKESHRPGFVFGADDESEKSRDHSLTD